MKIDYQLTKQDYMDYNIHHMSYSETIKRSLFIQRYLISIIFLIIPFMIAKVTAIPLMYWLVVFVVTYILWVAFYPKYLTLIMTRRISKMIDEGENLGLLGNHSISLTEDGIIDISDFSESKKSWNTIKNIVETKEHIFIYVSAVEAFIIPIRAFADIDQKDEFMNTLKYMKEKNKSNNNDRVMPK